MHSGRLGNNRDSQNQGRLIGALFRVVSSANTFQDGGHAIDPTMA